MALEHPPVRHKGTRPSERDLPPPPDPGSEEANFLARLNEVYGEEPDSEEQQIVAGMRDAFRRVIERER